jgi:ribose 5-phosphate isomerase A
MRQGLLLFFYPMDFFQHRWRAYTAGGGRQNALQLVPHGMANQQQKDVEKQAAAQASLKFVREGMVVGLGTGSTAAYMVRMLAEKVRDGLKVCCIPTSAGTRELAESLGIPLITFADVQQIDVTIDGADEFNPKLELIKGGGGALLHEKIVASASRQLVIVADESKQVKVLGKFPLPVEVVKFAEPLIAARIAALGATPVLRRDAAGNPFITDEGNYILDCQFGAIEDPPALARTLEAMPGVVEHGLFIHMANVVLVARGEEVREVRR